MCGGRYTGASPDLVIEGVTRDSRTACPGAMYIPIIGERFDGHDFAAGSIASGAVAMMWQKDHPVPAELEHVPHVLVKNTVAALQQLAASYRSELMTRVIGITGSNGKTTTKDLTAALLGTVYRVHKTEGNLNNELGLPLTLLELEEETEVAVLEMGMSGFGEIELLTRIAQPDAAIITNIGDAHMLQLGSRAGIAKAKLEIASGLGEGGILLYNGDEPLLDEGLRSMALNEGVELRTFGLSEQNAWSAENIQIEAERSTFTPLYDGKPTQMGSITIPIPGRHNVSNALAAIAVARLFGVPAARIAEGFGNVKLSGMRIQPVKAYNGAVILNDAFNANPTAAAAAIDLIEQLEGFRQKWIVLGDMLELGPDEKKMHFDTGAYVTPAKADALLAFGPLSRHTAEGARAGFADARPEEAVQHFEDKDTLVRWLRDQLDPGDVVLVKGSRGMQMEEIVQALERG